MEVTIRIIFFSVILLSITNAAFAQWANESELGVIVVSGNSSSQTRNLKQTTSYKKDRDKLGIKARSIDVKSDGVQSAESWLVGVRYDRQLHEKLGSYLSHDVESDRFAGFLQRDNTGLGATYQILNLEKLKWSTEAGYSREQKDFFNSNQTSSLNGARLYTNVFSQITETVSADMYVEYLYLFDNKDTQASDPENYRINAEPSLTVLMSNIFSLKLSYLMKYQNSRPTGVAERTDTTFSTTLVAKF